MKSPSSAASRASSLPPSGSCSAAPRRASLVLAALEQLLRDGKHVLLDDLLGERGNEAVVYEQDPVDFPGLVELGDAVRDHLGVVVRGSIAEADPRLVDLVAAEGQGRA